MGPPTFKDLTRKMRSGRISRRHFIQSASTLGISATSISSALRANSSYAQEPSKVTFWTVATEPDLSALQMIVDNFNGENSDVQAELVQVVGDETDTTKLMTAVRGGTGPDVYMLDRFIVAQRAAEGVLQDLSELMGARTSVRCTSHSPGPKRTSMVRLLPSRSTPTPVRSSTTRG